MGAGELGGGWGEGTYHVATCLLYRKPSDTAFVALATYAWGAFSMVQIPGSPPVNSPSSTQMESFPGSVAALSVWVRIDSSGQSPSPRVSVGGCIHRPRPLVLFVKAGNEEILGL